MILRLVSFAVVLSMTISVSATAQSDTGPLGFGKITLDRDLESDRPDFTEGTQTVEAGHLQLESGYTYSRDSAGGSTTHEHTVPEALLRVGLAESTELRLGWTGYSYEKVSGTSTHGWTDLTIGFKQHIDTGESSVQLGVIGEVSLPVGSRDVKAEDPEPALKLLWAADVTERFGLAGNLNVAHRSGAAEDYSEVGASLTGGLDLTERLGSYIEYFGIYPLESVPEPDEHYLNGGLTYLVTENFQLDLRVGFGLNSAATDLFTGTGFVVRV